MTNRRLTRRTFSAFALGAVGTALIRADRSRADASASAASSTNLSSQTDAITYPTGADDLVMRVEVLDFVSPRDPLTRMPIFSLYGDGRAITLGPQILIYPPPALPNLQVTRLTEEGIQRVLQAAREAGLLEGDKTYRGITVQFARDPGTAVFTVNAEDRTNVVSVWAPDATSEMVEPDEREPRQKLQDFMGFVTSLSEALPDSAIAEPDQPFEIERLQIVSQPADAAPDVDDPTLVPDSIPWPLDISLADFGEPLTGRLAEARCGVVEDAEAEMLVSSLMEANQLTPWESEGTTYVIYPRPLLPDEAGCADLNETIATPPA